MPSHPVPSRYSVCNSLGTAFRQVDLRYPSSKNRTKNRFYFFWPGDLYLGDRLAKQEESKNKMKVCLSSQNLGRRIPHPKGRKRGSTLASLHCSDGYSVWWQWFNDRRYMPPFVGSGYPNRPIPIIGLNRSHEEWTARSTV